MQRTTHLRNPREGSIRSIKGKYFNSILIRFNSILIKFLSVSQAADWSVAGFNKSHGCRLVGEHSFEVRYSRDGSAPVRTPIGDGSGDGD